MEKLKPFTYLIGWSKHRLFYYGSRYARNSSVDDLWTKYFTSSAVVKKVRAEIGEPDIIQIRKTFKSAEEAPQMGNASIKTTQSSKKGGFSKFN